MRRILKTLVTVLLTALPIYSSSSIAAEDVLTLGDGVSVRVLWFEPENVTAPPPLAILMPGGSDNEFMAHAQYWLGRELVDRGWALAVPISDQGRKFFVDNSDLMLVVVEQLRERHAISDNKPILVGVSSGGSAALAVAAKAPDHYSGVIAAPGRIWDETRFSALQGLPIYLRVGEKDDFRWHRNMDSNAAQLREAGAKVNAALVPGASHIFSLDWPEIEEWLSSLQQPD